MHIVLHRPHTRTRTCTYEFITIRKPSKTKCTNYGQISKIRPVDRIKLNQIVFTNTNVHYVHTYWHERRQTQAAKAVIVNIFGHFSLQNFLFLSADVLVFARYLLYAETLACAILLTTGFGLKMATNMCNLLYFYYIFGLGWASICTENYYFSFVCSFSSAIVICMRANDEA